MNEWGIPDWINEAAYQDASRWTLVRWRWEFRRRKSEYRDDATAFFHILEAREAAAQDLQCLNTSAARQRFNEVADLQQMAFETFWKRWNYCEVLDPRTSEYPDEKLKTLGLGGITIMDGSPSSEAGMSRISPRIGQTAIVFDLNQPLAAQLEIAARTLTKRQKALEGKLIQRRRQPLKWQGYLRTLDAREAGASWAKIAEIHPNTAKTAQTARDIWKQADALRFNF